MRYKYNYVVCFHHSGGSGTADIVCDKPIEKMIQQVTQFIENTSPLNSIGISSWKLIRKQRIG